MKVFRIKYPQMSDEEIFNFVGTYLLREHAEKSDFLFNGRLPLDRICCMGPYLQEEGDYMMKKITDQLDDFMIS